MRVTLALPWPPSVNHYWRAFRGRAILSKAGREYRARVENLVAYVGAESFGERRLSVRLHCRPPDERRRDLDNCCKAILDGLAHAGLYLDDSQIDHLEIDRGTATLGGSVVATIEEMPSSSAPGVRG